MGIVRHSWQTACKCKTGEKEAADEKNRIGYDSKE